MLQERSSDIRVDTFMHTPVHIAVIFQDVSLLRFLIHDCACEIDIFDMNGWTALSYIAITGDPNQNYIAKELLRLGADIHKECRDSGYESALDFARDKQDENPSLYKLLMRYADFDKKWESLKALAYTRLKLKRFTLI